MRWNTYVIECILLTIIWWTILDQWLLSSLNAIGVRCCLEWWFACALILSGSRWQCARNGYSVVSARQLYVALSSCKPHPRNTHTDFSAGKWRLMVGELGLEPRNSWGNLLVYGRSTNRHDIISSGRFSEWLMEVAMQPSQIYSFTQTHQSLIWPGKKN